MEEWWSNCTFINYRNADNTDERIPDTPLPPLLPAARQAQEGNKPL